MVEESFTLPTLDGFTIYGRKNVPDTNGNGRALVIAHGLTGHINEYLHQMAMRAFIAKGYTVYRFSFYESRPDARKLAQNTTLQHHSQDLSTVVSYVKNLHKDVYVAGHSYGGLTTLIANPDVNAVAFWDSSYVPEFWNEAAIFCKQINAYLLKWECTYVVCNEIVEEGKSITMDIADAWAKKFKAPALVLTAGANEENSIRTCLWNALIVEKSYHDVPNADHCFYTDDTVQDLIAKTHDWFEAH